MHLIEGGVPWDVVVAMPDDVRLGWVIARLKREGRDFDFLTGRVIEPKE